MAMILIDDRPFEMLSQEEKDAIWMKEYDEKYHDPTPEELEQYMKENAQYFSKESQIAFKERMKQAKE